MTPTFKFAVREDLKDCGINFLPERVESTATGWDVKCAIKGGITLKPFEVAKVDLGFRAFCPEGYWFKLVPRSSSFVKKHLHFLYGTIDEGYEGILVGGLQYLPPMNYDRIFPLDVFSNYTKQSLHIEFGERFAQIIPVRRQEMIVEGISNEEYDKLCKERNGERGKGGFGSSGS